MLGASEEAFEAFGAARRLDPVSPVVLTNYRQLAMITGRTDEAFEAARDNLRWNPQNHTARFTMGSLSLEAGSYEHALVCLSSPLEALRSDPDFRALRSMMEERAAKVRSGIDSADKC